MATPLLKPKLMMQRRSTLNFGYWLVIGLIGWMMLSLVTGLRDVLTSLPLYETIPLTFLIVFVTGVTLKMLRDEWWIRYLNRQKQFYIGQETVLTWCSIIDSMWLVRKPMRRELRHLYKHITQTKISEEAKETLAMQLVERGILIVYSRPKSDHPA
ncbi:MULTISPECIES: hypothetical protein [unclassified Exiguobacterium]|uniref:hypothetical protein n=1 Tax=unclassified Exiguobacterium TaxID=2644629 RepID=UPI000B589D03|nr:MULTISPECIES: hypothetical protein [unclassified Exiguobacterium]ASI36317.1 hypothetical protein A0126_12235 [Exiguobacterium sp. N4-1P]